MDARVQGEHWECNLQASIHGKSKLEVTVWRLMGDLKARVVRSTHPPNAQTLAMQSTTRGVSKIIKYKGMCT